MWHNNIVTSLFFIVITCIMLKNFLGKNKKLYKLVISFTMLSFISTNYNTSMISVQLNFTVGNKNLKHADKWISKLSLRSIKIIINIILSLFIRIPTPKLISICTNSNHKKKKKIYSKPYKHKFALCDDNACPQISSATTKPSMFIYKNTPTSLPSFFVI